MRIIHGVTYDCYERVADELSSRFAKTVLPDEGELLQIELDDNVILKCYDTDVLIILGNKKEFLQYSEFTSIHII